MARPLRIDHPGARHHVMNRGARRASIFPDDAACALFLAVLQDLPAKFDVRVHAFALLPNHYHLLLETPEGGLSRAMAHLGSEYVRLLNRMHGWDGPLFRGRFRNQVVESEEYWKYLLLYVHLNPVEARLASNVDDTRWTSHAAYTGQTRMQPWLTTHELLELHGGIDGYRQALEDVRMGRTGAPVGFDPERLWHAPRTVVTPRAPRAEPDVAAALARIANVTGADPTARASGRGENRPRWVAAWWLRRCGLPQRTIAKALGANEQQVSRWLRDVVKRRDKDDLLRGWMDALEVASSKS